MKRREFLHICGTGTGVLLFNDSLLLGESAAEPAKSLANAPFKKKNPRIDRRALVARHKVVLNKAEALSPLSVGNGEFGFTADVTGLQTFPEFHDQGIRLGTLAQWAWHSKPNPHNYQLSDILNDYDFNGKQVPFPSGNEREGGIGDKTGAGAYLHSNPHKFDLGRIGLTLPSNGSRETTLGDLQAINQELDLWTGILTSRFELEGQPVRLETVSHPERNMVAVRIVSPLIRSGKIGVHLHFPNSAGGWSVAGDWNSPDSHSTLPSSQDNEVAFVRTLEKTTRTFARAAASSSAKYQQESPHKFSWKAAGRDVLELVVCFAPLEIPAALPRFASVRRASLGHWERYWTGGGAIDLSASTDPRWKELERRIVLSQFQTALNCAGSLPPQESGLVQNSWFGKFHLEMHWWHAAHFALWGRPDLLKRSMGYYTDILPIARDTASRIGCRGARWPKMVGPDGIESGNFINPFLTWQQPHPIHMAELLYQSRPTRQTLEAFKDIVLESAEFMASYATWNEERKGFELGGPIVAANEQNFPRRRSSKNPTFDIAYWSWTLGIANQWRERLGMSRSEQWDHVRNNFVSLPVAEDGIYKEIEKGDSPRHDHPSMLGALGIVGDTDLVDHDTMQKTLDYVLTKWPLNTTWGWDYPMMAMTAARLGRPDQAVDSLLLNASKNRYLTNGHNHQTSQLPLYLPGNGGLLFAVAMMAAGWKNAPQGEAPGFPTPEQGWTVRWEGLRPAL
jgi:hypothetical protein